MNDPAAFALHPGWQRAAWAMTGVGFAAAAGGVVWTPQRAWPNVLLAGLYLLFIALSGALLLVFQYLSGAGWSAVLRRVPEAMMSGLPTFALLLALSIVFGRHALYSWASHEPLAAHKAAYFSAPFVFLRMALVLGAWVFFARGLRSASVAQDQDPDPIHHRRLARFSAGFAAFFAVSFSLASVDWLMSLDPHWSSTIYAVYVFAGVVVLGLAVTTLTVILLRESGSLAGVVNESHLHDLGKLLFAFTTFWAYIWLSQYLLIWYGNLPEEVTHYVRRTDPAWVRLFLLNVVVNWLVPFMVLLPRAAKRSPRVLKWLCVLLLFGRWLDLYLIIMPETHQLPRLGPLEVLIPLGCAGLFVHVTARALARAPLVPLNDPFLEESLRHHT